MEGTPYPDRDAMGESAVCAVIVGNGQPPSRELLARAMEGSPLLLCADGGANTAAAYGHLPDCVVGDLDSVDAEVQERLPPARLLQVAEDDTGTDLQKVLRHAVSLGVQRAELLGFTGRRTDHTLWNLSLLKAFGDRLDLRIVDD